MGNEIYTWSAVEAQLERYHQYLREAEKEGMIRRALAERDKAPMFFNQILLWLGHRLVTWGCALQNRYQPAFPVNDLRFEKLTCSK